MGCGVTEIGYARLPHWQSVRACAFSTADGTEIAQQVQYADGWMCLRLHACIVLVCTPAWFSMGGKVEDVCNLYWIR